MKESKAFGVASMIIGSISIPFFLMPYFGLPMAILAVVFYGIQRKRGINGYATAGLVTGITGIVINSVVIVFLILALILIGSLKSVF